MTTDRVMHNKRLLVIDDDQDIWKAYQDVLTLQQDNRFSPVRKISELLDSDDGPGGDITPDYQLCFASQGEEGYALVEEATANSLPFAVAFIDVRMPPGWDGMETAVRLRRLDPNLEIVIVTAYGDRSPDEIVRAVGTPDKLLYLRKPFDPDELAQIALSLTEKWNLTWKEQLQRRELQAILVTTPAAIFTVDENHRITSWNPAAESITGYRADEILEEICPFSRIAEPPGCRTCLLNQTEAQRLTERELIFTDRAGEQRTILLNGSIVRDEQGDFVKAVESFWDITERKKNEAERARLEEQYRQSQKMEALGTLAGGIAHDLNNILTPIMGYTQLCLMQRNLDETMRENLKIIDSSAGKAADLLNQILSFSRKQVLSLLPQNLNQIINRFSKMLKRLIREDINLHFNLESQLWSTDADVSQIEQILINLVVNARDACPANGNLTISTANETVAENTLFDHEQQPMAGDYVVLSVKDDGMGMDPRTLERAFDPFFTTKEAGRGTGIGLSTVYGITRQHNGHIVVDTKSGQGTAFHIYFPRSRSKASTKSGEKLPPVRGGSETILVVEDSREVRRAAVSALRHFGYQILEASNGATALELLEAEESGKPDLLLTDVVMPDMGGKALAAELHRTLPGLPVIFMSGHTFDTDPDALLTEPGSKFIQKPFTPREIALLVREMLDKVTETTETGNAGESADEGV